MTSVKFVPPPPPFKPAVYRCILKDDPRNDCYRFVFRFGPYCITLDQDGCPGGAGWVEDELNKYRSVERLAEYPQPKAAPPHHDDRFVKQPYGTRRDEYGRIIMWNEPQIIRRDEWGKRIEERELEAERANRIQTTTDLAQRYAQIIDEQRITIATLEAKVAELTRAQEQG